MQIYILRADFNKYQGLYYEDEATIVEFNRRFNGKPLTKIWGSKGRFRFLPGRFPKGDCPGLSTHIPVFSPRAVLALGDLLENNGEMLPITCEGEEYFLFNVTRLVNALDKANCDLKRFDDGGIMDIERFSFFPDKLVGLTIFKIPQLVLMDTFVTDSFVDRVSSAKLKGFKFRLVWSSER